MRVSNYWAKTRRRVGVGYRPSNARHANRAWNISAQPPDGPAPTSARMCMHARQDAASRKRAGGACGVLDAHLQGRQVDVTHVAVGLRIDAKVAARLTNHLRGGKSSWRGRPVRISQGQSELRAPLPPYSHHPHLLSPLSRRFALRLRMLLFERENICKCFCLCGTSICG